MTPHKELKHILVVDDEAPIRTLLRDCFELEGYVVSEAGNGIELLACLEQHPVDLITLDLNLDGENGLDLARQTRTTRNIPIIMITGKGDTVDRIVGLELGADDYITKPFHVREVLARVRAVLRRYDSVADNADGATSTDRLDEQYAFGEYVLDIPRRELRLSAGEVCELTTGEFDMLVMFIKRPNRVLSRDNIMDLLKGREWSPLDRSIDSLVVRLRRKIEPDPASPTFIKTVRGVGYVFTGEVRKA